MLASSPCVHHTSGWMMGGAPARVSGRSGQLRLLIGTLWVLTGTLQSLLKVFLS